MQAIVTVTIRLSPPTHCVHRIGAYNAALECLLALGRMVESLGRICGADWLECDLWQSEEMTTLTVARTASNAVDAQAAETLIDSFMYDIRGEVQRASRWRLSYETTLETGED